MIFFRWPRSLRKCEGGSLSERELGGEGAGMQKSSLTLMISENSSMSFVRISLCMGKGVAFWDSNLHRNTRATAPLGAGAIGRYKLKSLVT